MQRNSQALLGLFFFVAVAVVLILTRQSRVAGPAPAASASQSAAPPPSASAPAPIGSGAIESAVETALSPDEGAGETFDILPDGRKAPPLPDTAPQSVTFGVVQFAYDGAQFTQKGSRTKQQAKEKARSVVELAQKDFEAAVQKGDRGSRANVGRMHRGILEPAVEYVLFTLPKASVYAEPVDTPRGFWIVRRID